MPQSLLSRINTSVNKNTNVLPDEDAAVSRQYDVYGSDVVYKAVFPAYSRASIDYIKKAYKLSENKKRE